MIRMITESIIIVVLLLIGINEEDQGAQIFHNLQLAEEKK